MVALVKVLKALSSEPRLKIFRLLKERSLCVNAITGRLGVTQSAVSQHLRVLREAGLVEAEKRGCWMHYSVRREALEGLGDSISRLFDAPGRPCAVTEAGRSGAGGRGRGCATRRSRRSACGPRRARASRRSVRPS
ncbi:MAG: ArsR/SmtB family transcription factor [Planctomycetota bacterium]|jgi:ArsR family transcriptional regulator